MIQRSLLSVSNEREDADMSIDSNRPVRIVVPHDASAHILRELRTQSIATPVDEVVTEWWVEKCLYSKRLEKTTFVLHRPLEIRSISGRFHSSN